MCYVLGPRATAALFLLPRSRMRLERNSDPFMLRDSNVPPTERENGHWGWHAAVTYMYMGQWWRHHNAGHQDWTHKDLKWRRTWAYFLVGWRSFLILGFLFSGWEFFWFLDLSSSHVLCNYFLSLQRNSFAVIFSSFFHQRFLCPEETTIRGIQKRQIWKTFFL